MYNQKYSILVPVLKSSSFWSIYYEIGFKMVLMTWMTSPFHSTPFAVRQWVALSVPHQPILLKKLTEKLIFKLDFNFKSLKYHCAQFPFVLNQLILAKLFYLNTIISYFQHNLRFSFFFQFLFFISFIFLLHSSSSTTPLVS